MFVKMVAIVLAVVAVAGCQSMIVLPNGEEIEARKACGDFSETKCAPLGSPRLALKEPAPLAVTESGPKVLDYLGMLGPTEDESGNRTYDVCGEKSGRISPFHMSDMEIPVTQKVEHSFSSDNDDLASVKADLISSLSKLGLSAEILDQLTANVSGLFDRFSSATSKTKMEFRYYRLKSDVMMALANPGGNEILESCRTELKNQPGSSLYKGLTGLYFFKSDFSEEEERTYRAELAGFVNDALKTRSERGGLFFPLGMEVYASAPPPPESASSPPADSRPPESPAIEPEIPEGVLAEIERLTTKQIKISTEPYFRILGLELWRP